MKLILHKSDVKKLTKIEKDSMNIEKSCSSCQYWRLRVSKEPCNSCIPVLGGTWTKYEKEKS